MSPATDLATRDQHLGDQGSELHDDELAAGLREQLAAELAAIKQAEKRLALGTYGVSIESGEPIPDERLEAHPTAKQPPQSRPDSSGSHMTLYAFFERGQWKLRSTRNRCMGRASGACHDQAEENASRSEQRASRAAASRQGRRATLAGHEQDSCEAPTDLRVPR